MTESQLFENEFDTSVRQLNADSIGYLSETAKWAKFLAIIGFIVIGLGILGFVFNIAVTGSAMAQLPGMGGFGIAYILFVFLYMFLIIYPTVKLYQFATKTRSAIEVNENTNMTEGLKNLKSLFKFYGILMIFLLAFYAILIIFLLTGGVSAFF